MARRPRARTLTLKADRTSWCLEALAAGMAVAGMSAAALAADPAPPARDPTVLPAPQVDQDIRKPPPVAPDSLPTPVIPPPGTPGGDPTVVPK